MGAKKARSGDRLAAFTMTTAKSVASILFAFRSSVRRRALSLLFATHLAAVLALTGCGSQPSYTPPNNPPPPPPPATVTVTPPTATAYRGDTVQFSAQVSGSSDKTVTWSVPSGLGSIDSTGLYTASSEADGSFFVTATSNAVPSASGTALVTLPVITFLIAPYGVIVKPGANTNFNATLEGLASASFTWAVQETGAGSINSSGVYTAPATGGAYHIVATSTANALYRAVAIAVVSLTASPFTPTGDTNEPRVLHTATLLSNGKVLVAGGYVYKPYCFAGTTSAELYDQDARTFSSIGSMNTPRYAQTSTLLANGDVLIAGGFTYDRPTCSDMDPAPAVKSAELYDPAHGSFQSTGNMAGERGGHTATLLADGKVLVAGGSESDDEFQYDEGSAAAEVYDPAIGAFTPTGIMTAARVGHNATLLADGKVLITGGWTSAFSPVATAELYDPSTETFSPTGSMTSARGAHTATLLLDGRVLITGGVFDATNAGSKTAEIYNPTTGSFAATDPMDVARQFHTATLLPNKTVLVVGGGDQVAEIFDPASNSFSLTGITEIDRFEHSATLLQNGTVVVIGGVGSQWALSALATAELY